MSLTYRTSTVLGQTDGYLFLVHHCPRNFWYLHAHDHVPDPFLDVVCQHMYISKDGADRSYCCLPLQPQRLSKTWWFLALLPPAVSLVVFHPRHRFYTFCREGKDQVEAGRWAREKEKLTRHSTPRMERPREELKQSTIVQQSVCFIFKGWFIVNRRLKVSVISRGFCGMKKNIPVWCNSRDSKNYYIQVIKEHCWLELIIVIIWFVFRISWAHVNNVDISFYWHSPNGIKVTCILSG